MRSVHLGNGDGAIERHDWRRRELEQVVIELQDLRPVGRGGTRCLAVHGIDRRLKLVRPGLIAPQALANERLAFRNQLAIPPAAILINEQDDLRRRP